MARTITDSRQIALRRFLEQLGNRTHHDGTTDAKPAGVSELDNLLDSIDLELTPPLKLDASNPANLTINVGAAIVTNTETNRNRTIPHVGSLLPNDFTSGTVVFPSSSGGNITITPGNDSILTVPSNEYVSVLLYLDPNGDLNVLVGESNAVEADASVLPPPTNTLPIGYVTLFNNAGTIDNVEQTKIFQFGTGAGGGGGAGDSFSFEDTITDRLCDSIFEAATPYIAEREQDELIDVSSTGAFDLVSNRFKLESIGETLVSEALLDDDFLASELAIDKAEVLLKFDSEGLDTAAVVELSRNGGTEWQAVTMERIDTSNVFRGLLEFEAEAANQTIVEYASSNIDSTEVLTDTLERVGQIFTLANTTQLRDIELYLEKTGTPIGNYSVRVVKDNSGDPSTDANDLVYESAPQNIEDLTAGNNTINVGLASVLPAGDYHIVIVTDATYRQLSYNAGVDEIAVRTDASSPGITEANTYSASAWSALTGEAVPHKIDGIELDLRLRVTSSVVDVLLEGFGVLYEQNIGNLATASIVDGITKVSFKAVADNSNSFALPFTPNPDTLVAYLLGSGMSFRYGDFSVQGNTVIFAQDQFNNGGLEKTQTVIFDQLRGGAFDNSDVNRLLIAANHLGNEDGGPNDLSVAGRGLFLRSADGTKWEVTVLDDGSIETVEVV